MESLIWSIFVHDMYGKQGVKFILARGPKGGTMRATQCLGRLVKDAPKDINMLRFEDGQGLFHIPFRCELTAKGGDLCDSCRAREKKTQEKVAEITGTTIKGTLPSYLMGRVTEPIPFWSRLYGGAWYNLKIEEGCIVSEQNMARAKKAAAAAYDGVETVEPQPMPGSRKTKTKAKVAPVVAEVAPVVAKPLVAKPPPKKRQPKQTVAPEAPVAVLAEPTQELPVESVREVRVRKREIDGRSLYLGPKDKVYDLKFKYLGRLKEESIVSFPDSDAEL